MDFRARVTALCRPLPGAEVSDPWGGGHDAWKVGGKIFALIGSWSPGVSVKCPDVETAAMLIEVGAAARAKYLHRSWVHLPDTTGVDELRHRILASYGLIVANLPKALRRDLMERA